VFRWEPDEGTVLSVHVDRHEFADGQFCAVRITDAKGSTLYSEEGEWFVNGVELPIGASGGSVFLAHWSSGAHGFRLAPYFWDGKTVQAAATLRFDADYFTIQQVRGELQLILLAKVERRDLPVSKWPYVARTYAWAGKQFMQTGIAPASAWLGGTTRLFAPKSRQPN